MAHPCVWMPTFLSPLHQDGWLHKVKHYAKKETEKNPILIQDLEYPEFTNLPEVWHAAHAFEHLVVVTLVNEPSVHSAIVRAHHNRSYLGRTVFTPATPHKPAIMISKEFPLKVVEQKFYDVQRSISDISFLTAYMAKN